MPLSTTRLWVLGTALLSVVLVLAGYFLVIGPKRAEAADLRQQAADTRSSNAMLENKIEQLKAQFAELPQRQAELAEIKQAMPEDAALPTLVRDLDQLAAQAGVTLMSLAPGEPTTVADPEGAPPAGAAAAAPADGAAAPTTAAAASSDLLVSIPTSLVIVGDFHESELFLKNLQTEMPRAFLVQGLTVQADMKGEASGGKPATVNGDVTMTIAGSVFVLKPGPAATPPAATAPPAAAPATAAPPTAPAPAATSPQPVTANS